MLLHSLSSLPSLQFMRGRMHSAANCQYAVHEYLKAGLRSDLEVSPIGMGMSQYSCIHLNKVHCSDTNHPTCHNLLHV